MAGFIVIVAFISPYEGDRNSARRLHEESKCLFREVYISTSLECCERRDVKGLYKKARAGEIKNFTGITDPYEAPSHPDLVLDTQDTSLEECFKRIVTILSENKVLNSNYIINDKPVVQAAQNENFSISLEYEELNLLQLIKDGWCPLKNFMNETELLESLYFKTFSDNGQKYLQSIPIILPIKDEEKEIIQKSETVNLVNSLTGKVVASINGPSVYQFRKEEFCNKVFGIDSNNHPKVSKIFSQGGYLLTGKELIFHDEIKYEDGMDDLRLSSGEIRKIIAEKNVDVVYAFQLRNPLHNGHCMLLEDARAKLIKDGYKNPLLLLHPCGGWTKDDDVPLEVRIRQHKALIDNNVLNRESTLLAIWPSPMYYAGPLEVLWHFSSREFAGVNYMIVGRDPAGVKHPEKQGVDLYDPFHGQKVLEIANKSGLLKMKILPFKVAAYNRNIKGMEYFDPSRKDEYDMISGTQMRTLAKENKELPENFMHVEGWKVLADYYKNLNV